MSLYYAPIIFPVFSLYSIRISPFRMAKNLALSFRTNPEPWAQLHCLHLAPGRCVMNLDVLIYIYICWIYFDVSWMYSTCVGHTLDLFWIVLDIYVGFFGCVTVWCLNDVSSRMWEDVWCWFVSPESDDFSRLIPLHRSGFGSPLLSLSLEKNKKNLLDLVSLALGHSWVFSQPLKLNLPNKSLFIEGFLVTKNHSSGWLNPSQSPRKSILNWLRVAGCRR